MTTELRFCSLCRENVQAVQDEADRSIVCTSCGMVLEDMQIETNTEHMDKGALEYRKFVNSTQNKTYIIHGNNSWMGRPIVDREAKYKNELWDLVKKVCSGLKLGVEFINDVKQIVNEVLMTKKINPGRSRLIPAAICLISRRRKVGLTYLDIADACGVPVVHLSRWYRNLVDRLEAERPDEDGPAIIVMNLVYSLITPALLEKHNKEGQLKADSSDPTSSSVSDSIFASEDEESNVPSDWDDPDINTTIGKLRHRIITSVQRILKLADERMLTSGRNPGSVAAAATHIVISCTPETTHYANLKELCTLTHTTIGSIEHRVVEMKHVLLGAARETFPWASDLTLPKLDEMIPAIVSHLEMEAKLTARRQRLAALSLLSASPAPTPTTSISLPTIVSKRGQQEPSHPDLEHSAAEVLSGFMTVSDTDKSTSIANSETTPLSAQPRRQPLVIKFTPSRSTLSSQFPVPVPAGSRTSLIESSSPPPTASLPAVMLPPPPVKTPPKSPKKKPVKPKPEPRGLNPTPSHSFAPAYVRNVAMKAKRAEMVKRAKIRLANFAKSLSEEEVAMFGVQSFVNMQVDPADAAIMDTSSTDPEEDAKIEQLLMEGVSEDLIIERGLAHHSEKLNAHYNAVVEQFADDTDELIRTSAEIAALQEQEERSIVKQELFDT